MLSDLAYNPLAPWCVAALAVAALMASDWHQFRPGRFIAKPVAALCFLWLAWILGAADTQYGQWLFAGLVCCLLGDLFLMPDNEMSFLAGLVSFLLGHLLYAVAFVHQGSSLSGAAYSAVPALLLMVVALRWMWPHLQGPMRAAVPVYTAVITGMLITAGLCATAPPAALVLAGAWGFAVSDLAVARQQFVAPGRYNGLWGSPLYFGSQMLLASSVALN